MSGAGSELGLILILLIIAGVRARNPNLQVVITQSRYVSSMKSMTSTTTMSNR